MANQRMLNTAVRAASIALLMGLPIVAASGTIAQTKTLPQFITEPQLIAQQPRQPRTALVIGNGAYQLQKYLPERLEFGSGRSNGYSCQDLTQGIGLAGMVFFKNMPTKFNQVPLVEFGFHRKQDRFKIQFQNVSIGP